MPSCAHDNASSSDIASNTLGIIVSSTEMQRMRSKLSWVQNKTYNNRYKLWRKIDLS